MDAAEDDLLAHLIRTDDAEGDRAAAAAAAIPIAVVIDVAAGSASDASCAVPHWQRALLVLQLRVEIVEDAADLLAANWAERLCLEPLEEAEVAELVKARSNDHLQTDLVQADGAVVGGVGAGGGHSRRYLLSGGRHRVRRGQRLRGHRGSH